ncbi:S53 family peptidase [Curvibacter sp. HBC28]|uniref:S53 family peptidase n=1 Tax=Curvibacter microcysteis TaxID=3026419 RepID=A0ABT5MCU5_9BURK|nr:S53 family peptidase [Curvibacter sp. HBC28]MDD0814403.1 S53 family peptidase [Curvibacter sp. HBC28]
MSHAPIAPHKAFGSATLWFSLSALSLALLGCGGGDPGVAETGSAQVLVASGTTILNLEPEALSAEVGAQVAQPTFHLAPVLLDAPDDSDANGQGLSASFAPRQQMVPAELASVPTRQLTLQGLDVAKRLAVSDVVSRAGSAVSTYSPAQIRAAYGLPALPAAGATLTAAQAAQYGAGQTIYVVDAMHNPNTAAELSVFNQKFGLPTCATKAIATTAALPLPAASASACELSVVHSTPAGGMTATAPAYDSGWATEISLDVQWAHAIAPLARIVLIEAADPSLNSLLGGVKLANAMGPGIVSMSFGATEGNWTASVDSVFTNSKMSYLAAAGDSGTAVLWPAVSSNVLAVGGTSLTYSGTGARSEVTWSGTGGGTSAYTAKPAYQTTAVPGLGNVVRRTGPDVAMNADPSTGQYVAVMNPGSSAVNWVSAGGTSMSTPQWAGLLAVANAIRAQSAKPVLGAPHAVLYGQISTVPGNYASAFADITRGNNGTCITCAARVGFDPMTGLGTPNASSLLAQLSGASAPAVAPVVTPASITGVTGTALSFTASVSAANAVSFSLSGAPAGMAISSSGVVSWASPVAGSYKVTVTAKDNVNGLSGQGVYTVTITPPAPPTVGGVTVSGKPGVALSFNISYSSANPVTFSLAGAPAGMVVSSTGVVSWTNPVLGNYNVTATVKDSKTGLSAQGVYAVKIANAGPVITAPAMTGVAGKAMTGTISIADPGASWVSVSISGVPLGMGFAMSGLTITAKWPSPVTGSYTLTVTVVDNLGLTATVKVPVTVTAK